MAWGVLSTIPWYGAVALGAVLATAAGWAARSRIVSDRSPAVRPTETVRPDRDLVSLAVTGVDDGRLAPFLRGSRNRLNRWSMEHTGTSIDRLPGLWARLRRRESPRQRTLRALRGRLAVARWRAVWLGRPWLPSPWPWRTRAGSLTLLRRDVAALLQDVDRLMRTEGPPP